MAPHWSISGIQKTHRRLKWNRKRISDQRKVWLLLEEEFKTLTYVEEWNPPIWRNTKCTNLLTQFNFSLGAYLNHVMMEKLIQTKRLRRRFDGSPRTISLGSTLLNRGATGFRFGSRACVQDEDMQTAAAADLVLWPYTIPM